MILNINSIDYKILSMERRQIIMSSCHGWSLPKTDIIRIKSAVNVMNDILKKHQHDTISISMILFGSSEFIDVVYYDCHFVGGVDVSAAQFMVVNSPTCTKDEKKEQWEERKKEIIEIVEREC